MTHEGDYQQHRLSLTLPDQGSGAHQITLHLAPSGNSALAWLAAVCHNVTAPTHRTKLSLKTRCCCFSLSAWPLLAAESVMMDRAFDRAFSRAAAASDTTGAETQVRHKKQAPKSDTQEPGTEATPMQISDAVQRILQADKDKDYIRYTGLPY